VAYKKDQGRFARMAAFWALFGLMAYGCLGGMVYVLDGWIGQKPWLPMFPLLGKFGLSEVIALGVLAVFGVMIFRWLNKPKVADMLIDTEGELRKVTWPNAKETWAGTIAVAVTVLVLLAFLFSTDVVLTWGIKRLLGVGS
jgi:preprotein translocase SecE subunit